VRNQRAPVRHDLTPPGVAGLRRPRRAGRISGRDDIVPASRSLRVMQTAWASAPAGESERPAAPTPARRRAGVGGWRAAAGGQAG
jgi:hypothetical protein